MFLSILYHESFRIKNTGLDKLFASTSNFKNTQKSEKDYFYNHF